MNASIRFCDNCGATNRFDARFCYSCGQPQLTYSNTATGLLPSFHELKQRYRILDKLGQGGFGAIYKVQDMLFSNAIRAVKEMGIRGLNAQETQDAIVAFKNEALLLAHLDHPNLPRIYDHFEDLGRWYLVMDYIHGETLAAHLDQAPNKQLPVAEVIQIGLQICEVLGYLHSHQPPIIFRDLKPDNVMLTANNHLYLIDFGIARLFKPGQARDTVNLGTPGYASPEQYGRNQTTIRSDIYSLGATLYHLVTGINPGLNPFLFQALDLDPQEPGNAALEVLILHMLEMKEERRPIDTTIVKQELQRIQQLRQNISSTLVPAPPIFVPQKIQTMLPPPAPQPSLIVAQHGGGQYTTISEAIQNALPNTLILVQKGVYQESLLIDKDLDILGNGPKDEIILESSDNSTISMQTSRATLRGLTIRCRASSTNDQHHALAILQGQLSVEDCDLTSQSSTCIVVQNSTTFLTMRYCTIHDSASHGLAISEYAQGTIEHCEIFGNTMPAITITTGGNPTFRHCTIRDNHNHGMYIHHSGQGTFEDCEFQHNQYAGVVIATQSNPLLLRCQIHANQHQGINVQYTGQGSIQECDIHSNAHDNVAINTGSTPYLYRCKIHDGQQAGVAIQNDGQGTLEYCEINANTLANIIISDGGNPVIQYSRISQSKQSGISVYNGGKGTIANCTITKNAKQALTIAPDCHVVLKNNQTD